MIIESISITNFRQFLGEVSIELSTSPDKNITVIHGANGSGKTSLLNAFKWCFYGQTDFDTGNENILNEAAIQSEKIEGIIELNIAVKFTHDGLRYAALRSQQYRRKSELGAEPLSDSVFALDVTGEDGQTKRSKSPFVELQAILPVDLQPYFFFNGERIEHIAGVNQGVLIQEAIRKLMGLELVDRAISHVGKARNQYRKLVKEEVSEEEQRLLELIEHLEENISNYNEVIKAAKREEELSKFEIKRIETDLKKFEKSRTLQERRNELENLIAENAKHLDSVKGDQKELIDENGFLALSKDVLKQCDDLIEKNRKKGILPYGIKEQFIDDRIEMGTCICGTKIAKGSTEHDCLLSVRKTAGTDQQESAYTCVAGLLKGLDAKLGTYGAKYKKSAQTVLDLVTKNDQLKGEANEISAQLTQIDDQEISVLENLHKLQTVRNSDAMMDRGIAENNKTQAQSELEENRKNLEKLQDQKTKQNIANIRMKKTDLLVEVLEQLSESLSNQVRVDLSERVDRTFQSIIRKPVRAIIDDEYRLQILKSTPSGEEYTATEQSTGEKQVTSLSFISSIIDLAKEKFKSKASFFHGGLYPLVMDSPFGSLDDDYRSKVAERVSTLAEQVIMFVSNSQWNGNVKKACKDKVGKSYQLVYHSPKITKKEEDEYTVVSDSEFEYSVIKEVKV